MTYRDLISKDEYFITLAWAASLRSTCPRRHVGAVLVSEDGRILSTGYNGAPPGMSECLYSGCLMVNGSCVNTIHAEVNCLSRSREVGAFLYSTDKPCINCLKEALSHNRHIKIVYWRDYSDEARDAFVKRHELDHMLFQKNDVELQSLIAISQTLAQRLEK